MTFLIHAVHVLAATRWPRSAYATSITLAIVKDPYFPSFVHG